MKTRLAENRDLTQWLQMRKTLWPLSHPDDHLEEMKEKLDFLAETPVFVAEEREGQLTGFVEAGSRARVPGAKTSPVSYVEGWFVAAAARQTGVGKRLLQAAEGWALENRLTEMVLGLEEDNEDGRKALEKLGYREVSRDNGETMFSRSLVK